MQGGKGKMQTQWEEWVFLALAKMGDAPTCGAGHSWCLLCSQHPPFSLASFSLSLKGGSEEKCFKGSND